LCIRTALKDGLAWKRWEVESNAVRDAKKSGVILSLVGYWLSAIGDLRPGLFAKRPRLLSWGCIFAFVASGAAETVDRRDFSIDTFYPSSNVIRVAEKHCQNYWAKHKAQYAASTRYLAVEAAALSSAEIVNGLWVKLINSETATEFFAHGDRFSYSNLDLKGILIYDTLTSRFVSRVGYVSVDLPARNRLARWDHYIARFIGTGRWG
jgi:hypothetical protein